MGTLQVIQYLITLATAAADIAAHAAQVSAVLKQVQADGRAELTAEEWAKVSGMDDAARQRLENAIKAATLPPAA